MSELQRAVTALMLRLDRMGMRVEQAVLDAIDAVETADVDAGRAVADNDVSIDLEEVAIEEECIRLLALYQPAGVDLRSVCAVIKANNDLERIADLAANIGKRARYVASEGLVLKANPLFCELRARTLDVVGRTVRMLSTMDTEAAKAIIALDKRVDEAYKALIGSILDARNERADKAEVAMTLMTLAKSMERIGDSCTNIAEDIIFLRTGDIVRHAKHQTRPAANQ